VFPLSEKRIGSDERKDRIEDKKQVARILKSKFPIIDDDPFEKFNKFNAQNEDGRNNLLFIELKV